MYKFRIYRYNNANRMIDRGAKLISTPVQPLRGVEAVGKGVSPKCGMI